MTFNQYNSEKDISHFINRKPCYEAFPAIAPNGRRYEIVGDCGVRHYHPTTNVDAGQNARITT